MPSQRPAPPSPERRSANPADEAARWKSLALTLLNLLARSRDAQAADARRHEVELEAQRVGFAHHLSEDREIFMDLVAHELRTPLAVVKAYAELLEAQIAEMPSTGHAREVAGQIVEQADAMTALVEEVLDVQRLRRGKLALELGRVDLVVLTRQVARDIARISGRNRLRVFVARGSTVVQGDRRRLRQVLVNLLENAVKYSDADLVEVLVDESEHDGRRCALLTVRDRGIGIEAADLGRIFQRFEQLSTAPVEGRVGLGLGLYLARQIARAHQGDVLADSPGRGLGSTFTLRIPLRLDPDLDR